MNPLSQPRHAIRRVVMRGGPFERGQQYGRQARDLILESIASYRELFFHRQKLSWAEAIAGALTYEASIDAFAPEILEEIHGIANGAEVESGDILALNTRSELMFAPPRSAAVPERAPGECTSFALLPEATQSGHTLIGQNWDWIPFAGKVLLMLEVHRDDGPGFVSITEAGLIAKMGCNAAGLGVCTNTLVSRQDNGRPGVPYHVMLRKLLDCETITEAARMLTATPRALSANYLVAHASGLAFNAESLPGDAAGIAFVLPEDGMIAHTNHFVHPDFACQDARVADQPHSLFRLDSMRRNLRRGTPGLSVEFLKGALQDHRGHPDGVCSHPDQRFPPIEQRATLASMIVDLDAGELWVASGPPCTNEYERFDLRSMFSTASELINVG
jgi:isopenicillin-N N-acyltransferase-like protein